MVRVYTFCAISFKFNLTVTDREKQWVMCKIVWQVFLTTKLVRSAQVVERTKAMLRGACEWLVHRGCGCHGCRKKKDGSQF
jgi:hypothetical protein